MPLIFRLVTFLTLVNATPLFAQSNSAFDGIWRNIYKVRGNIGLVDERVTNINERLLRWEAELDAAERGDSFGRSRPNQDSDFNMLFQSIVQHPLRRANSAECQDVFGALARPDLEVNTIRLEACSNESTVRAAYPTGLECASLFWVTGRNGTVRLEGAVSGPEDRALLINQFGRQTVSGVVERPYPACAALEALVLPMTVQDRPEIRMLSNRDRIAFKESLAFQVRTPDFYSFMYVAYLQADGAVVNLTPRRRVMRQQYDPLQTLYFGDGHEGRQTYTASAPAGSEAIIAVASRSPIRQIDELERGNDGQFETEDGLPIDQASFLKILEVSLSDRVEGTNFSGNGPRQLSAEVLHVTIVP